MLTHGNIFASVAMTATIHVRTAHDRVYSALPFPHVYGNVVMNAIFLTGARLIAPHRFDAATALEGIAKEKRSEEHTSELQSLMRTSYAVFCLKKKITT